MSASKRHDTKARTPADLRKFGITVGIAFGVIGGIVFWRGHGTPAAILWSIGGALVLGGLAAPRALGPVERAWMAMAHAISKVTTPLFMGIVYFVVLSPVGLLRRTFGGNPLRHEADGDGYWFSREETGHSDLERQF